MVDSDERQQQILDAAAAVIIRLGYDKTTMSDIAGEAGMSRRTVYLYFPGKEELFEALLYREYLLYAETWIEQVEADPRGGSLGGAYRALFYAVSRRPLIAAMQRRDQRVIGNYLRKRDNLFSQMISGVNTAAFFQALQAAGAIRQDIDPAVLEHVLEILSYGQLTIADFKPPGAFPPDEAVMEAIAGMLDRAWSPQPGDGGLEAAPRSESAPRSEAGKAIFRQMITEARAQLEQLKQAKDMKQMIKNGAAYDER